MPNRSFRCLQLPLPQSGTHSQLGENSEFSSLGPSGIQTCDLPHCSQLSTDLRRLSLPRTGVSLTACPCLTSFLVSVSKLVLFMRELISALFSLHRYRTIPLLCKSKFSSFKPSAVTVQPGLCQTWLETPKKDFFAMLVSIKSAKNKSMSRELLLPTGLD